jgi:hypothetical protein
VDRVARFLAGGIVLGLYGTLEPPLKYLALLGVIPLATGLSGFCLVYHWLGISTTHRTHRS